MPNVHKALECNETKEFDLKIGSPRLSVGCRCRAPSAAKWQAQALASSQWWICQSGPPLDLACLSISHRLDAEVLLCISWCVGDA